MLVTPLLTQTLSLTLTTLLTAQYTTYRALSTSMVNNECGKLYTHISAGDIRNRKLIAYGLHVCELAFIVVLFAELLLQLFMAL